MSNKRIPFERLVRDDLLDQIYRLENDKEVETIFLTSIQEQKQQLYVLSEELVASTTYLIGNIVEKVLVIFSVDSHTSHRLTNT